MSIKQRLFDEYDGFADRRIKRIEKGKNFIVDDRSEEDMGSGGRLLSYVCMIFAEVTNEETPSAEEISVTLCGNVPDSLGVQAWAAKNGVKVRTTSFQRTLKVRIARGEQHRLRSLASAIRAIVSPGARYSTANYKYVCPRTATSLERLAKVLDEAWP
jgi:hypothetical protein